MDRIIRVIVITSASLTALVLFWLGIKQIRINEKKKPCIFMTALLIALTLIGCDVVGYGSRNMHSPVESSGEKAEKKRFSRIAKLNNTQEWRNFKAFWRKLDRIVPQKKAEKEKNSFMGEYAGSISAEEANTFRGELKELISELRKFDQERSDESVSVNISPTETELLERICTERINYIAFGFGSMLCRMMPPPSVTQKERTIKDLEQRIDTLIELREKARIDKDEFRQALSNIQQDIRTFSVLDTIGKHYVRYYFHDTLRPGRTDAQAEGKVDIVGEHMAQLERHYADYQARKEQGKIDAADPRYKDLDIKYKETKRAIEELKKILPSLNELVMDLEK